MLSGGAASVKVPYGAYIDCPDAGAREAGEAGEAGEDTADTGEEADETDQDEGEDSGSAWEEGEEDEDWLPRSVLRRLYPSIPDGWGEVQVEARQARESRSAPAPTRFLRDVVAAARPSLL